MESPGRMATATVAFAALALPALLGSSPATAQTATGASGLKIVQRISGPDGRWDYSSFDSEHRRVLIAHHDVVLSVDADSGKLNPDFAAGNGLHGVVPAPGTGRIVTTNGGDNTAKVVDAASGALIASIAAPKDTDSAAWDPSTRSVVVIGGDSGEIVLVDPVKLKASAPVKVAGSLEFGEPDGKGRFFVNVEDDASVAVLDLASRQVVARWPMTGCQRPTGLAYVAGERIVSACGNGVAKILDATSGKEIASLAIGTGADAVLYDPVRQLAMIPSGRSGTLAVIALSGPAANTIIDTVKTQVGARSGAVDPKTGRVWLPAAQYNPPALHQRPEPKPGTFEVLVLDR